MNKALTKKKIKRPPLEPLYPYVVFLFLGFCVADLLMIPVRGSMLPTQVPPARQKRARMDDMTSRGTYSGVATRNIFSADGVIPDTLAQIEQKKKQGDGGPKDAPPVLSSLPLTLIGTIVHTNPAKSIANIELKSKTLVLAVRVSKDIDTLATLVSVERGKVIIRNLNNQRLEYIELKNLSKVSFSAVKPAGAPGKTEVKQTAQNKFEISRADVLKYTSDMSSVLQQAAMQPRRKANGEIDGFKFLNIQPNSIYSQLGFQVGDTIKSVNGEPVDSPAKAMELYNALKASDVIKIGVEREGHEQENEYHVNK